MRALARAGKQIILLADNAGMTTPKVLFNSADAAYQTLRGSVFPAMSEFFRLYKGAGSKFDEYLLIKPLWKGEEETFVPQIYRADRDINDMMLSVKMPTTVIYPLDPENQHSALKKDGILAAWRREPETQQGKITGFCYVPDGGEIVNNQVNMFRDVSVKAYPTEDPWTACEPMLRHIGENLCNGNLNYAEYVIKWLAHMVQRPNERPGTGIAIIGGQGTGKGIFIEFVKRLLGGVRNANTTASATDTKSFNYSIGNKLFVVFDEATFAGDRQQSDFMKKLVTEPRIRIEQKGIDAYEVDNFARVLITSNNMTTAVPADIGARRWLIIECKNDVSSEELAELRVKIGNAGEDVEGAIPGFVNQFKYFLQYYPLDGFNPMELPMQNTGFETKLIGTYKTEPVKAFLWQWLLADDFTLYRHKKARDQEQGVIDVEEPVQWGREVKFADVFECLRELTLAAYGTPPARNNLGRLLKNFGIGVVRRGGNVAFVSLPPPEIVYQELRRTSRFDDPVSPSRLAAMGVHWAKVTHDPLPKIGTMEMGGFETPEEQQAVHKRALAKDAAKNAEIMAALGALQETGELTSEGVSEVLDNPLNGFAKFGVIVERKPGRPRKKSRSD